MMMLASRRLASLVRRRVARASSPRRARDDAGFGLVEAVVALFLLGLIIVPVTRVALTTTAVSNSMHLRVEAADIASQRLATVENDAGAGQVLAEGVTTDSETSGSDEFTVSLDVEPVNATALCTSGGVPQAWSAKATVSWGSGGAASEVAAGTSLTQSTLIPAPRTTGSASGDGEIAIPIDDSEGVAVSDPQITVEVVGSCTGSSCPATPYPSGPPYATEQVSAGTVGCAVFTDLFAGNGWSYTAAVTNSDGYVDPAEHSSAPGATDPTLATSLTPTAGVVATPAGGQGFELEPGDPVEVGFEMTGFAGGGTPPGTPASALPITVDSTSPGLSCQPNGCTLGDGVSTFTGSDDALLYPVQTSGGGGDDYQGWAGGAWADPSSSLYCGSGSSSCGVGPTSFDSASGSVQFPVYPLTLDLSGIPAGTTSVSFDATPVGSSLDLALNPVAVASGQTSASSSTGLPLGEYSLSTASGFDAPNYVWITPTGVCTYSAQSAPSTPCASPSTTPVAVSAS